MNNFRGCCSLAAELQFDKYGTRVAEGHTMLRIEFEAAQDTTTAKMEGQFVGHYATDAFDLFLRHHHTTKLLIDLSQVTLGDEVGEGVLLLFGRWGVSFVGDSPFARDICERLRLPLVNQPPSNVPRAL